jgi:hypothetical protein
MARIPQLCVLVTMAVAAAIAADAHRTLTVEQLVSFIKSSIQLKHDDRQVADFVRKIKLSDKLEAATVETLQGMGAGRQTVTALRTLIDSSANLTVTPPPPPPPPKPVIPPPDSIEQKRILAEIIENARNYTKSLPDYMCVQVTRRRYDPSGTESWRLADTIQEQLNYVEHKESYKVAMINGRAVANVEHNQLGGAISSGEFGSIYAEIFAAETDTEFEWDHWATLRGRRMYVFSFHVPQSRSSYRILDKESMRTVTAGYHGLIYADRDTVTVMRYKMECEDIPSDFPVKDVKLDVNYDFTKIADHEYVLPLKTEIRSRYGKQLSWNEAEFHLYKKFGADTSITFDTPDPIPEEKTKEEPAKPDAKDVKKDTTKKQ